MTGIYYTDMLDVLRGAGCKVAENSTTNGWQTRARGSGGFPNPPLCVFWHHTASQTSPANDLAYMIHGSPDAPVGNVLLDRTGTFWPVAAGASNCAGKGGPSSFSRGTIPMDQGNTYGFQIEAANNGVGELWPQVQIDAFFRGSNALNARFGNLPTDIISHALGTGDGYTSRKIDPAVALSVEGPWMPRTANSSGTWTLADMRSEAARRAGSTPPPDPGPGPGPDPSPPVPLTKDDTTMVVALDKNGTAWVGDGITRYPITDEAVFNNMIVLGTVGAYRFVNTSGQAVGGWDNVASVADETIAALGRAT